MTPYTLKSTIRSLIKNRGYSILNIFGLAIGLTCFAFIALWVNDELSYDRHHKKADRIFRVAGKVTTDSETFEQAVTSPPMAAALVEEIPEIKTAVRIGENDAIVKRNDIMFEEDDILLTDPSFFDVFDYKLLEGDPKTALLEPYSIILTTSIAQKYFGDEDPMGKTLRIFLNDPDGQGALYKVTGLIADAPKNAHFHYNILGSFKTFEIVQAANLEGLNGWYYNGFYTYLLLEENTTEALVESKLPDFIERHIGEDSRASGMYYDLYLQPLTDIYLHSDLRYEIEATGNMSHIYIFSCIGIFILLIAGINYVNLTTARAVHRAKEVGVKKILGALRKQLIGQYLFESLAIAFAALGLAIVLSELIKPLFIELTDKNLSLLQSPTMLGFLALTTFLLGLASGVYPGLVISAFKPVTVMRGMLNSGSKGVWLRKSLAVFQFTISIGIIVGLLVVYSQMRFIQNYNLGFNQNALITLKVNGSQEVINNFTVFKNELLNNSLIEAVTTSNSLIGGGLGSQYTQTVDDSGKAVQSSVARLRVDEHYLNVYNIPLIAGRNFQAGNASDSASAYLVNETALKSFGWATPEDAIGKPFAQGSRQGQIIGVMKDFNFNSLDQSMEPVGMAMLDQNFSQITVRVQPDKIMDAVQLITSAWKSYFPNSLFQQNFLDKMLAAQYEAEQRFGTIFGVFSSITLLIACLGLLGLATYAAEQRTKEIGIRKVLGANVQSIVALLSKDFLVLVLIAALIAFPIAWWVMSNWLQDFAYHIDIQWWMFALAGFAAVAIALATVSFQAIQAAVANPVNALKNE
ncbi:MAG: ABC transporter permease [Saprospiraceae bacterium]|nr:ABC transporter permease [Saprospiraceae bacterium]